MGINAPFAEILVTARAEGAVFAETVTVGRQSLAVPGEDLVRLGGRLGMGRVESEEAGRHPYAETFLSTFLGAKDVVSIDNSSYQGAGVVHDMNAPVPAALCGRFDALVDGGTMEHIFDVKQVLTNYMNLIKVGGRIFICVPSNNLFGHGFYQFSPELFYRVFDTSNGFAVRDMVVTESPFTSVEASRYWRSYSTVDPAAVGKRVRLVNQRPVMVSVHAERVAEVVPFARPPQQSDYSARWKAAEDGVTADGPSKPGDAVGGGGFRPFAYLTLLQEIKRRLRQFRKHTLGNRKFFKPVAR